MLGLPFLFAACAGRLIFRRAQLKGASLAGSRYCGGDLRAPSLHIILVVWCIGRDSNYVPSHEATELPTRLWQRVVGLVVYQTGIAPSQSRISFLNEEVC